MAKFQQTLQTQGAVTSPTPQPSAAQAIAGTVGQGLEVFGSILAQKQKVEAKKKEAEMDFMEQERIDTIASRLYDIQTMERTSPNKAKQKFIEARRDYVAKYGVSAFNSGMKRAKEVYGVSMGSYFSGLEDEQDARLEAAQERQAALQTRVQAVFANQGWLGMESQQQLKKLNDPSLSQEEFESVLSEVETDVAFAKAEVDRRTKQATMGKSEEEFQRRKAGNVLSFTLGNTLQGQLSEISEGQDLSDPKVLEQLPQQAELVFNQVSAVLDGRVDESMFPDMSEEQRQGIIQLSRQLGASEKTQIRNSLKAIAEGVQNVVVNAKGTEAVKGKAARNKAGLELQFHAIIDAAMNDPDMAAKIAIADFTGIQLSNQESMALASQVGELTKGMMEDPSSALSQLRKRYGPQAPQGNGGPPPEDTPLYSGAKKVSLALLQPTQPVEENNADYYKQRVFTYANPITAEDKRIAFGPEAEWRNFLRSQVGQEGVMDNMAVVYSDPVIQTAVVRTAQRAEAQYTKLLFRNGTFGIKGQTGSTVGGFGGAGGAMGAGNIPIVYEEGYLADNFDYRVSQETGPVLSFKDKSKVTDQQMNTLRNYNEIMQLQFKMMKQFDSLNGTDPFKDENSLTSQFVRGQLQTVASYNPIKEPE